MAKLVNKHFGTVAEHLSAAVPSRQACEECSLHENCQTPFLRPFIPRDWTKKVLFVFDVSKEGEAKAERDGLPLSDRERTQVKAVLAATGLTKADVAFAPTTRCQGKASMMQLRACRPFLVRIIAELKPSFVFLCGENALKQYTNSGSLSPLAKTRGRELAVIDQSFKSTFFLTGKLGTLLTDPHSFVRMKEDLSRILSPPLAIPKRPTVAKMCGKTVALDTEYYVEGITPHLMTAAVSDGKHAFVAEGHQLATLGPVLATKTLIGHNVPVDIEACLLARKRLNLPLACFEDWLKGKRQRDTSLLARLEDENRGMGGYSLESMVTSKFNLKDWKAATACHGNDPREWPPALRQERCRVDAFTTHKLYEAMTDVHGPAALAHAIQMTVRRMYWTGVYIDSKKFDEIQAEVTKELTKAEKQIATFSKKMGFDTVEPTKDAWLAEYLFSDKGCGLEIESYTPTGKPKVSVKTLKEYKDDARISALLSFSKYSKLSTTYGDNLRELFRGTLNRPWMTVNINALAAKTGRRTSNGPNWQNLPPLIRQIVISRFKHGVIADNDYSKLEPILGGWVAHEPRLTDYFVKNPNGYISLGTDFFKKTVEKNTKEYTAIKSLILAILYMTKKWSLAENLWVQQGVKFDSNYQRHEDKVGEILDDFLDFFPGIKKYQQRQTETVLEQGYVTNALGQRRRLPLPPEPPKSERMAYKGWCKYRAHVINQAVNYPIQSLASYVTGSGMVDLEAAYLDFYRLSYAQYQEALMECAWPMMPLMCIEVHDDIVQDVPKNCITKAKEITHDVMHKPPSLVKLLPELFDSNVKLSIDTNVGERWGLKT